MKQHDAAGPQEKLMSPPDPFTPTIAWRQGFAPPKREPVVTDVQDGRAEYLLSGPYRLAKGGKIEVVNGQLLFTGSSCKIN